MRHISIIILLPLLLLVGNVFASELDSLDVRLLVQKQFEEARSKQAGLIQSEVLPQKQAETKSVIMPDQESDAGISGSFILRILILLVAGAVVGLLVVYNRKRKKSASEKVVLKKNIQLMRQEKFIKRIDPRLKQIRTNLCLTSTQLNGKPARLSAAKKLSIGKEELAIATRIKNYEQHYNYDRGAV